jgi:hypothetical protein
VRRAFVLGGIGVLVLLVTAGAAAVSLISLASPQENFPNRLAESGDIFGAATLLLTVIAALVALRAYAVSTGLPDLRVKIEFEFSYPNRPVFRARVADDGGLRAEHFKQTSGTMSVIHNGPE